MSQVSQGRVGHNCRRQGQSFYAHGNVSGHGCYHYQVHAVCVHDYNDTGLYNTGSDIGASTSGNIHDINECR